MINCHFVWPAVHMPDRGRETRLVPVALSSFISIREVYYLCFNTVYMCDPILPSTVSSIYTNTRETQNNSK